MLAAGIVGLILFGPGLIHLTHLAFVQHGLDRRLAKLAEERETLTLRRDRLETDQTYVEGLIRSTFKVAKPGELVLPLDTVTRDK